MQFKRDDAVDGAREFKWVRIHMYLDTGPSL